MKAIASKMFTRNLEIPENQLSIFGAKNAKQDLVVYSLFTRNPDKAFTCRELEDTLRGMGYNFLLTSIRRSVTTLKDAGYIIKTGQKMEREGSQNNTWQIVQTQ